MLLDDCYRLLDLDPRASDEEVRRAHRDLLKVWHPDRFAHDPSLRQKAEEKTKTINEAYETITNAREKGWRGSSPTAAPAGAARDRGEQIRRYRRWATSCVLFGMLFLLRRPTASGLAIAAILFCAAAALILRTRALPR